jgi:hypothetical protein
MYTVRRQITAKGTDIYQLAKQSNYCIANPHVKLIALHVDGIFKEKVV